MPKVLVCPENRETDGIGDDSQTQPKIHGKSPAHAPLTARRADQIFRPDCALISARLGEMEPPSTGKREYLGGNFAAEINHSLTNLLETRMVKDNQNSAGLESRPLLRPGKATGDSPVFE